MLQLYRLYVVHAENKKANELKLKQAAQNSRKKRNNDLNEMNHFNDIYIISNSKCDKKRRGKRLRFGIGDLKKQLKLCIMPYVQVKHRLRRKRWGKAY